MRFKILLFFVMIFLISSALYSGSIRQEHFVVTKHNDDNTVGDTSYVFNIHLYFPDMYGFCFISDNRNISSNGIQRLERRGILIPSLTIGAGLSYGIKKAALAYSYDPAVITDSVIKGNYFEPGAYLRFDGFRNSLMLELYYGRRVNSFSSNSNTPDNFVPPSNNKENIFKASLKSTVAVAGHLDMVSMLDEIYAKANSSTKYGISNGFDQFKKINIFNPKVFIEYNKFPYLAFSGISFIYTNYNSYYLGNSFYWLDKYDNNLYAVPEKSIPVDTGFLSLSGFKFSNIFKTFVSLQAFNSLLICNRGRFNDHLDKVVDGVGGGIDLRFDFFSMIWGNLGFLNGNLLIGYMTSFEFANNKTSHLEGEIFFRYNIVSKW